MEQPTNKSNKPDLYVASAKVHEIYRLGSHNGEMVPGIIGNKTQALKALFASESLYLYELVILEDNTKHFRKRKSPCEEGYLHSEMNKLHDPWLTY